MPVIITLASKNKKIHVDDTKTFTDLLRNQSFSKNSDIITRYNYSANQIIIVLNRLKFEEHIVNLSKKVFYSQIEVLLYQSGIADEYSLLSTFHTNKFEIITSVTAHFKVNNQVLSDKEIRRELLEIVEQLKKEIYLLENAQVEYKVISTNEHAHALILSGLHIDSMESSPILALENEGNTKGENIVQKILGEFSTLLSKRHGTYEYLGGSSAQRELQQVSYDPHQALIEIATRYLDSIQQLKKEYSYKLKNYDNNGALISFIVQCFDIVAENFEAIIKALQINLLSEKVIGQIINEALNFLESKVTSLQSESFHKNAKLIAKSVIDELMEFCQKFEFIIFGKDKNLYLNRRNEMEIETETEIIRKKAIKSMLLRLLEQKLPQINQQQMQKPSCFICYAWGVEKQEKLIQQRLYKHLQAAGVQAFLDIKDNKAGTWISQHTQRIGTSDIVIVVCSTKLMEKYKNQSGGSVVNLELEQVFAKLKQQKALGTVITVLVDGTEQTAKPAFLHGSVHVDFTDKLQYSTNLLRLLESIYAVKGSEAERVVEEIRIAHQKVVEAILKGKMERELKPYIEEEKKLIEQNKQEKKSFVLSELNNIHITSNSVSMREFGFLSNQGKQSTPQKVEGKEIKNEEENKKTSNFGGMRKGFLN